MVPDRLLPYKLSHLQPRQDSQLHNSRSHRHGATITHPKFVSMPSESGMEPARSFPHRYKYLQLICRYVDQRAKHPISVNQPSSLTASQPAR
jgi:hypothetical protein